MSGKIKIDKIMEHEEEEIINIYDDPEEFIDEELINLCENRRLKVDGSKQLLNKYYNMSDDKWNDILGFGYLRGKKDTVIKAFKRLGLKYDACRKAMDEWISDFNKKQDMTEFKQLMKDLKREYKSSKDHKLISIFNKLEEVLNYHLSFGWTKGIFEELTLPERLEKSKKLKTWEHSYKKAVETDSPIEELDESVKQAISDHLRAMKNKKQKKNKKTKNKKKRKKSKKKK